MTAPPDRKRNGADARQRVDPSIVSAASRYTPRPQPKKALVAAVYDERDPRSAGVARVVPPGAVLTKVGSAIVGYEKARRVGRKPLFSLSTLRVQEVQQIIGHRHGGAVDVEDGDCYLTVVASAFVLHAMKGPDSGVHRARSAIEIWAARWTPLVAAEDVERIGRDAVMRPLRLKADAAAAILALSARERDFLGIRTIGAIDRDADARKQHRAEKHRERERLRNAAKRREAGRADRASYEATSISETCRTLGIGRTTYYRHLAAGTLQDLLDRAREAGTSPLDGNMRNTLLPNTLVPPVQPAVVDIRPILFRRAAAALARPIVEHQIGEGAALVAPAPHRPKVRTKAC